MTELHAIASTVIPAIIVQDKCDAVFQGFFHCFGIVIVNHHLFPFPHLKWQTSTKPVICCARSNTPHAALPLASIGVSSHPATWLISIGPTGLVCSSVTHPQPEHFVESKLPGLLRLFRRVSDPVSGSDQSPCWIGIPGEVNTQSNSLCCHSCHTFAACKWILFVKLESTALFISLLSSGRKFFDGLSRRRRRWKQHYSSVKSNHLIVIWLLASWALVRFENTAGKRCHCWSQWEQCESNRGYIWPKFLAL